ncbi:hypothetical protein [Rhodanobacter sp. MP1X3]|uniref:hypothetical protein n=1 Tax=Rhodanobacter sp. MP1X3 TaxID=2723086 RepID=UPI00161DBC6A|nr:hypothetical protein [Rhodanobacter sp. MP1X3]MBB6241253.1 ribosomal protein L17 [Rhodanobacter sp. MP1X3]
MNIEDNKPGALATESDLAPNEDLDNALRIAREQLGILAKLVDEAKTSGAAVIESQRLSAAALEAAKVSMAAAAENERLSASALEEAKSKLAETNSAAATSTAAAAKVEAEQLVVAAKSEHITAAQTHADKVRAELDKLVTNAAQKATAADGSQSRAQAAADATSTILTDVQATKVNAEAGAAAAAVTLGESKASAAQTKKLADKSVAVEEAIAAYEKNLKELETEAKAKLATIVGLLPGATSAGLASAFAERANSFHTPRIRWQRVFIGSLVLLVLLGVTGLVHVIWTGDALTYDQLVRLWLSRLPVAGALLWLTLHASRESALARRLEEDYGYKAAIASSFEGFHNQMKDLGTASDSNAPLKLLCENTLEIIGTAPGRIYERHELTVSPAGEAATLAANIATSLAAKGIKPAP